MTAFEILGIEDKELPVSNLLAYYLDPGNNLGYGKSFLNDFCHLTGIHPVPEDETVWIEREHHIKNNNIDILIKVGEDKDAPKRIICIENKINSTEGTEQTKRYYEALEMEYPGCRDRQYIYLTKNNSSVNLSSQQFIHIRYAQLGALLEQEHYKGLPLARDFWLYYIQRDKERFEKIDAKDRSIRSTDTGDYIDLIDYIVWKLNSFEENGADNPFFCSHGKSMQSADQFYQISRHNWDFILQNMQMNFHLESSKARTHLHMERKPYIPFRKLKEGKEIYIQTRDSLREKFGPVDNEYFKSVSRASNAELTVADFIIKGNSFKQYYGSLLKLMEYVDERLKGSGVIG